LNFNKTKVISNVGMATFAANNENVKVVKHFNLLGSVIDTERTCMSQVARILALGRAAINYRRGKGIETATNELIC